ncbi:MAG: hypothetical protein AAGL17_05015 [Cyanobacteria bacterium J06576_12]
MPITQSGGTRATEIATPGSSAITESWQVTMQDVATKQSYVYRTDEDGSAVRLADSAQ